MAVWFHAQLGAIQVLRNADGVHGGVSDFLEKTDEGIGLCSMLLALRGGGWESNFQKNSVT